MWRNAGKMALLSRMRIGQRSRAQIKETPAVPLPGLPKGLFCDVNSATLLHGSSLGYRAWAIALLRVPTNLKLVSSMKLRRGLVSGLIHTGTELPRPTC